MNDTLALLKLMRTFSIERNLDQTIDFHKHDEILKDTKKSLVQIKLEP